METGGPILNNFNKNLKQEKMIAACYILFYGNQNFNLHSTAAGISDEEEKMMKLHPLME
jgi:hypothetical protein